MTEPRRRNIRHDLLACGGICVALILLGAYCVRLNHLLYVNHGPFWDSVSYDNLLARVMLSVREGRAIEGLVMIYASTVVLPWMQAMLLAPFFEPSRAVAIWIQIFWVIVTALTAYGYFRRIPRQSISVAAGSALMFFTIAASFFPFGGLSDFRLDYLQYILFGLACLVYLLASADDRPGLWFLWGITLGLACLGRATTPVYIVLVFGPFLLVDLWQQRRAAGRVLTHYSLAGLICAMSCGWYYVTNFDRLHFYYVVTSPDANAALPLSDSIWHLRFVLQDIGPVAGSALLVLLGLNLCSGWRAGDWNWRALWCGIAPLGFLVIHGAGLNDHVSMVAVFGFVLFALAPLRHTAASSSFQTLRKVGVLLAVLASAASGAIDGYRAHTAEAGFYPAMKIPTRAILDQVTHCLVDDIERRPPALFTYGLLYTGVVNSEQIVNTMLFDDDRPAKLGPETLLAIEIGDAALTPMSLRLDKMVTPAHWALLPGDDIRQKIDYLAQQEAAASDYIIVPARDDKNAQDIINRYSAEITTALAQRVPLRPLCTIPTNGPESAVTIYHNEARAASAPSAAP